MQDLGNETGGADKLASLNPSFARGLQTGGLTKPLAAFQMCPIYNVFRWMLTETSSRSQQESSNRHINFQLDNKELPIANTGLQIRDVIYKVKNAKIAVVFKSLAEYCTLKDI